MTQTPVALSRAENVGFEQGSRFCISAFQLKENVRKDDMKTEEEI